MYYDKTNISEFLFNRRLDKINDSLDRISRNSNNESNSNYSTSIFVARDIDYENANIFVDLMSKQIKLFLDERKLYDAINKIRNNDFSSISPYEDNFLLSRFLILLWNNTDSTRACIAIKYRFEKLGYFSFEKGEYIEKLLPKFKYHELADKSMTKTQEKKFRHNVIKEIKKGYLKIANDYLDACDDIIAFAHENEISSYFIETLVNIKFPYDELNKRILKTIKACSKIYNHVENPYSRAFKENNVKKTKTFISKLAKRGEKIN